MAQIFRGFGASVLAYDIEQHGDWAKQFEVEYVDLDASGAQRYLSLHLPLAPETHHLLDESAFARIKPEPISSIRVGN